MLKKKVTTLAHAWHDWLGAKIRPTNELLDRQLQDVIS